MTNHPNRSQTTYILILPRSVRRVRHFATACKQAASAERAAQSAHGPQAGADCHLVARRDNEFSYCGLIMGRTTIGKNFGCGDSYVEIAREFNALGVERATREYSRELGMHLVSL